MANDVYKRALSGGRAEKLDVTTRLAAGAAAGMTATAATHPLDTIRLRLAMPKHPYAGMGDAFAAIVRSEGVGALYKVRAEHTLSHTHTHTYTHPHTCTHTH